MRFLTFSSDPHRGFVLWLLALLVLPMAGLFILGIYLQPLYGDLTRIGFYSEREFGWNSTQVIFPNTKLEFNASPNNSREHYKILVLGDSFSRARPEFQWQNYVNEISNESIGTMDINKILLRQILTSPQFRITPPKLIIFESVERELPHHLIQNSNACKSSPPSSIKVNSSSKTTQIVKWNWESHLANITQRIERKTKLSDINLNYAWKYLLHNMRRHTTHAKVFRLDIKRPPPFSNHDQSNFLIYDDDINKIKLWRDMGVSEMSCRIEAIRQQVEKNGYTRFVLLVAPDKLTAYADFLHDSKFQHASLLPQLSDLNFDVMPRLDKELITAIRSGEQDIYFPDDTHWASNGQRIAAETLITFMKYQNIGIKGTEAERQ